MEKARGAQVRARARWVEEGEKSTRYFFNLENRRQSNNVITAVKVGDKKVTSTEDILNEGVKFYKKLYTSNCISDDQIKRYISSVRPDYVLNEREKSLCEGLLKESECTDVVFQMKKK